jgi:hypothetical protein
LNTTVRATIACLAAVACVLGAFVLSGCSSSPSKPDQSQRISDLWSKSPRSKDWTLVIGPLTLEPHGDDAASTASDSRYYTTYENKTVPGFKMHGYVEIPNDDTRPLDDRVSGYLELFPSRLDALPEAGGFMRLYAKEHGDRMFAGATEDSSLAEKYPGMRVFRTTAPKASDVPKMTDASGQETGPSPARLFKEYTYSSGPIMGYETATKTWKTLEPGR